MTAKELLDRTAEIKNSGSMGSSYFRDKATVGGAFVGGAIGAYYGYSKHHNMLVTGLFGVVIGGLVSRLFMPA